MARASIVCWPGDKEVVVKVKVSVGSLKEPSVAWALVHEPPFTLYSTFEIVFIVTSFPEFDIWGLLFGNL